VHREACCGDQTDITLLWLMRACWLECSTQAAATTFDQLLRLGPKIRHYLLPSVLEEGARLLRHHGQLPQARLAIAHAHAMRERFTLLHTPVEAPAARAEAAALRAELGAVRWHGLAAEMPPRFEDDPLRLLEDSLAVVNA
jgi:hypothetical protein